MFKCVTFIHVNNPFKLNFPLKILKTGDEANNADILINNLFFVSIPPKFICTKLILSS